MAAFSFGQRPLERDPAARSHASLIRSVSMLAARFSAQRFEALFRDQRNHGETSERISPPPAQPRIEPEPRQQDRRQKRADRGLASFGFKSSAVELPGDPSLEMNQDRHDDKRERGDDDSDSARGWCL